VQNLRYQLRHAILAVVVGVALTLVPFFLPNPGQKVAELFHWPMLLVDRPGANMLPLNAGERVITLFLINVAGWAFSFIVFWSSVKMLVRRQRLS
jgi:hypothetical protein